MPLAKTTSPSESSAPDALVQDVYEAIKDAILANRLRPGTKLTHIALAESLGVSRTPVRESLERLYQEGYVTRIVNRGFFVAEIDVHELRDLYQTREALELYALRRVLEGGISGAAATRLESINAHYHALCMENLSRERLLVDRDFHLLLAEQAGNRYLCDTLSAIFERLILKRRVEGFHDLRGIQPYEDHARILEAVVERDSKTAEDVMHQHIEGACNRFIRYLEPGATPAVSLRTPSLSKRRPAKTIRS
ncbi:GntR family transcriptional regulator [Caballeronia sp. 15715]|jgi:GntR family transcriptional regulator, rspAB operon transcriptional repressor|uniref:GntR family transcriptional regulator n=1 Tax=unclassified Caballeronia TaxID=2646786 RepID=UPI0039E349A5